MENQENRGLINKKVFEDQLVLFVSSTLELSIYSVSLSHSWTLIEFTIRFIMTKEIGKDKDKGFGKAKWH